MVLLKENNCDVNVFDHQPKDKQFHSGQNFVHF